MVVFWIVAILTIIINFIPTRNQRHYSARLIISFIPLFLYGAFRVDYGLDYQTYLDFFNEIEYYGRNTNERMEIGYYYLNKILPSFRSLLLVQTLLICVAYFYLFKWYIPAKYAWLGFVLLFLSGPLTVFFMLSGIRNGIAISLYILSTHYIHKKKFIPFAIIILLAFSFHKSILIISSIAYYVSYYKLITNQRIIIWLSVMIFVGVTSSTVILENAALFISTYFDRYDTYIESAKEMNKGAGYLVSSFSLIVSAIMLLLMKDKQLTAKENMVIKLSLLFFLSYLLGPLNMRMSQYFASFFVVSSIIILYRGTNKQLKHAYFIAIFAYLIYALILWYENPDFSYDNYQSVLFS